MTCILTCAEELKSTFKWVSICTYMSTSGMHRRPFEGRHLVFICIKLRLEQLGRDVSYVQRKALAWAFFVSGGCFGGTFECRADDKCLESSSKCNGVNDCSDGSDENLFDCELSCCTIASKINGTPQRWLLAYFEATLDFSWIYLPIIT